MKVDRFQINTNQFKTMDANKIKQEISKQISDIDQSFYNYFGWIYSEKLLGNDIDLLEKMLKSISRMFTFYKILSICVFVFIYVLSFISFFEGNSFINMNKYGLLIMSTMPFLTGAFLNYKTKVKLGSKINLLKLLGRMDSI
jgi:hypothetical protein